MLRCREGRDRFTFWDKSFPKVHELEKERKKARDTHGAGQTRGSHYFNMMSFLESVAPQAVSSL